MTEEYRPVAVQPGKKSISSVIAGAVNKGPFPLLAGIGLAAALGISLTIRQLDYQNFLRKPLVRLDGTVIDERYVQPTEDGRSKYYFSLYGNSVDGITIIEVTDSYNPRMSKESLDTRLQEGTIVMVRARNTSPREYQAFARDVYVRR